uniref:Uncharacterized protein n=1 Tax=Peronospora matthiolae TaxID=2874970 RepID=A0AAV1URR0_9STRA
MTESKPTSNTLEECTEEGMVDYESYIAASSIFDHPPPTPGARDNTRIASNPFVERDEVHSPIVQRTVFDPASGMLHNTFDEGQAQRL